MEYINKVSLYGKVTRDLEYSHEFNGVPFYSLELEVPQKNRNKVALTRCYFRGDQLTEFEIKPGMILHITDGEFINSRVKGVVDISVLVNDYTQAEDYPEDQSYCEAEVNGEVTKIFTTPENFKGLVNFVIAHSDDEGKKIFSTRVIIWNRLANHVFSTLQIGDKVLIKGIVNNSTTMSRVEGQEEQEEVMVSEILGYYFTKI